MPQDPNDEPRSARTRKGADASGGASSAAAVLLERIRKEQETNAKPAEAKRARRTKKRAEKDAPGRRV